MSVNVTFSLGNFPQGFCWQGPQQYGNSLVELLTGVIAGNFSGIIIGPNLPDPSDQDKAWFRTNNDGTPDKLYLFSGQWLALNPRTASSSEVMIWKGSEASLWAYDGGDGTDPTTNPPTATTGAMWQVDHDFDFKMPFGAGTNPVSYDGNPATTLVVGDVGGEERHVLTVDELAAHTHFVANQDVSDPTIPSLNATTYVTESGSHSSFSQEYVLGGTATTAFVGLTSSTGDDKSHQNLPPFRAVFMARRTARIYFVAS